MKIHYAEKDSAITIHTKEKNFARDVVVEIKLVVMESPGYRLQACVRHSHTHNID